MLVRDTPGGLQVCMLQRTHTASFARSQYVFPGGRVDDADHGDDFEPICDSLDDATASARLGLDHGGLAWYVAAIRECFEEAGVLLARRADDDEVLRFDDPVVADRFNAARRGIHAGDGTLVELCVLENLVLLAGRLHFVAHWLTPIGERRRFDTRFFLAEAPPSQEPLHDDAETIDSRWVRPVDALSAWKRGELQMFVPTVASLEMLAAYGTVADAIAAAEAAPMPPMIEPRLVVDDAGRMIGVLHPDDAEYATTPVPEYVITNAR